MAGDGPRETTVDLTRFDHPFDPFDHPFDHPVDHHPFADAGMRDRRRAVVAAFLRGTAQWRLVPIATVSRGTGCPRSCTLVHPLRNTLQQCSPCAVACLRAVAGCRCGSAPGHGALPHRHRTRRTLHEPHRHEPRRVAACTRTHTRARTGCAVPSLCRGPTLAHDVRTRAGSLTRALSVVAGVS